MTGDTCARSICAWLCQWEGGWSVPRHLGHLLATTSTWRSNSVGRCRGWAECPFLGPNGFAWAFASSDLFALIQGGILRTISNSWWRLSLSRWRSRTFSSAWSSYSFASLHWSFHSSNSFFFWKKARSQPWVCWRRNRDPMSSNVPMPCQNTWAALFKPTELV